jgi:single-strand DNA-binding protein
MVFHAILVFSGGTMAGVNKAILIGNLGADPELRYTTGGAAVTELRIATSRRYTTKDGTAQEDTQWHRVVVWGKQAENCKEYLAKGRQVYVEGRLQTRQWEDRDGNKRYTTEIVAEQIQFLGGRGGGAGGSDEAPPPGDHDAPSNFGDDDIPF